MIVSETTCVCVFIEGQTTNADRHRQMEGRISYAKRLTGCGGKREDAALSVDGSLLHLELDDGPTKICPLRWTLLPMALEASMRRLFRLWTDHGRAD